MGYADITHRLLFYFVLKVRLGYNQDIIHYDEGKREKRLLLETLKREKSFKKG